jgi:galactokinase
MKERVAQAPGRVNLLGDHTDYNNGFVLPAAIDRYVIVRASHRDDDIVTVEAVDLNERDTFTLATIERTSTWRDYVRGVVALLDVGSGADLRIESTLPRGVGLSSSAALELAVARAFSDEPAIDLALLCRQAENEFVGVECGVMDQMVIAIGRAGHALFLDCMTLEHRHVPVPSGFTLVVCDSRIERVLAASGYNERRRECAAATHVIGVESLRDATLEQLRVLPTILLRRARHVITENRRVLDGVAALEAGDVEQFGVLMDTSHASLRDDFDVCPPMVDRLAAAMRSIPGCIGARMTGAGFGGSVVSLIDRDVVTRARALASDLGVGFYECTAVDGIGTLG